MTDRAGRSSAAPPLRRLSTLAALALVPWTVLVVGAEATLVFPWGLVSLPAPTSPRVVTLPAYLFRFTGGPASLPRHLLSWPTGSVLYLGAVASGLVALGGREDERVTAGLLGLAAVAHLPFVFAFAARPGVVALPVGAVVLVAAAWWLWPR